MAQHNDFGKQAEDKAAAYLQENGYEILERNFFFQHAEIDIIALKNNVLVVVEVKARSTDFFGNPESFVSPKKIQLLTKAIDHYLQLKNFEFEVRFDIISVVKNELNHIENAFYYF